MDRTEILKQAKAKLPDVNEWEMPIISIPIIKELPIRINTEVLPKTGGYYEVRYEKINNGKKVIWRLIGIYEP